MLKRVLTIALVTLLWPPSATLAGKVTATAASTAAQNWCSLVVRATGGWSGFPTPRITDTREIVRGGKTVGYFCPVEPRGYVVVSTLKELCPVKAYSTTSNLDPTAEVGMADLIKDDMEFAVKAIEARVGPLESAPQKALTSLLGTKHEPSWSTLLASPSQFKEQLGRGGVRTNYSGSELLLSSHWHQGYPYNAQCPPGAGCDHTLVGCVATAGGQIMNYWKWPPCGMISPYDNPYDWANMADDVDTNVPAQINAAAELCSEVGMAVNMDYGCGESGAYHSDMADAYFIPFRYMWTLRCHRDDYTADGWWDVITYELANNRPVHYGITKHSIVCDGYEVIGDPGTRYLHMNFGWDDNATNWYYLDDPGLLATGDQDIIVWIAPIVSLGSSVSGVYPLQTFPYRYVNVDADASGATFDAGQKIQFLPGVRLNGVSTDPVRFDGSAGAVTRLYVNGNESTGIRVNSGTVKLINGGGMTLAPLGQPRYPFAWADEPTRVYVGWEDGWGEQDGFIVERHGAGFTWAEVGRTPADQHGYWDFAVRPDTVYGYRVRAFGARGLSDWGLEVGVRTPELPAASAGS